MRMRKFWVVLILMSFVAFVSAACGGGGSSPAAPTPMIVVGVPVVLMRQPFQVAAGNFGFQSAAPAPTSKTVEFVATWTPSGSNVWLFLTRGAAGSDAQVCYNQWDRCPLVLKSAMGDATSKRITLAPSEYSGQVFTWVVSTNGTATGEIVISALP